MSDQGNSRCGGKGACYTDVRVRIPRHVSVFSDSHRGIDSSKVDNTEEAPAQRPQPWHLELRCHHPGVLWRGLLPMLEEEACQGPGHPGSPTLAQKLLLGLGIAKALKQRRQRGKRARWERSQAPASPRETKATTDETPITADNEETTTEFVYERTIRLPSEWIGMEYLATPSHDSVVAVVALWILPPLAPPSDYDRTPFASIVAVLVRKAMLHQKWTHWLSTLGGGYFGIKHLSQSLWLSRQQRRLAIWCGDAKMARQCTIHEAYNWMYAGRFRRARSVLRRLEHEVRSASSSSARKLEDDKLWQQIAAAEVCRRRLRRLKQRGLHDYPPGSRGNTHHPDAALAPTSRTRDDFQRVRIVSC